MTIMNTVEKSGNNKFPSGNLVYLVENNSLGLNKFVENIRKY